MATAFGALANEMWRSERASIRPDDFKRQVDLLDSARLLVARFRWPYSICFLESLPITVAAASTFCVWGDKGRKLLPVHYFGRTHPL